MTSGHGADPVGAAPMTWGFVVFRDDGQVVG
jgi:hypothetical protein